MFCFNFSFFYNFCPFLSDALSCFREFITFKPFYCLVFLLYFLYPSVTSQLFSQFLIFHTYCFPLVWSYADNLRVILNDTKTKNAGTLAAYCISLCNKNYFSTVHSSLVIAFIFGVDENFFAVIWKRGCESIMMFTGCGFFDPMHALS